MVQCTPIIDISAIIQPLMLRAVFKEGEMNLDVLIDVIVQDKIEQSLLANVTLPAEFKDLENVICLMLDMNKVKSVMAALRGEQPPEGTGIDKVLELIVNLQMLGALTQSLGGGTSSGSSGGTSGGTSA